jgi:MFS family permease
MFTWLAGSPSKPPVFLKFRSSKTFIITTVFTDVFIYEIIVPVMPFVLTTRSGVDPDSTQTWISIFLAVYGAATLLASPFCGYLADRSSSRKLPLLLGLLALAGSTVMLFIGNSKSILAAGRVLQGISAAVVGVVGLALLVDTVGPEGIGLAMGYVGLSMSLAILLAPMLSGSVFATAGYEAVFGMAFALIGLDIILRLVMVEKKVALKWLPTEGVAGEQNKHSAAQTEPKEEPRAPSTGIERQTVITPAKAVWETELPPVDKQTKSLQEILPEHTLQPIGKTLERLPPVLYLLSSRRVLNSLWACTIQASLLTAFDSILPLFVRDTFRWNSIGAGLIFLPIIAGSLVGPIVGKYSDKVGPRWFATIGFIAACPFLILLRLVYQDTIGQKVLFCALLALLALALTFVITPMMAEIAYAVDAKAKRRPPGFFGKNGAYAQAYGLFNMAWAAGSMIGPLLGGLVNERAGWAVTTLILGIVSLVTAIPTVIWTGGSVCNQRRRRDEENTDGGTEHCQQLEEP